MTLPEADPDAMADRLSGSRRLIRLALAMYMPMSACAIFVKAPGTLGIADVPTLVQGLGLGALISALVVAFSRYVTVHTDWGRRLQAEFAAVFRGLTAGQILVLALLSGFGEEVLFRGVLQPRIGIWPATLLFTALHFPVRRTLVPWTGFALGFGLAAALLTEWAGSLWPAILMHISINFLNLRAVARSLRGQELGPADTNVN